MSDVACFCGCLFSFDGDAAACPGCGKYAVVRTGTALTGPEDDQPREQRVLAPGHDGQAAAGHGLGDQALVYAFLDGFKAAGA
jgi:hypothetical protein